MVYLLRKSTNTKIIHKTWRINDKTTFTKHTLQFMSCLVSLVPIWFTNRSFAISTRAIVSTINKVYSTFFIILDRALNTWQPLKDACVSSVETI